MAQPPDTSQVEVVEQKLRHTLAKECAFPQPLLAPNPYSRWQRLQQLMGEKMRPLAYGYEEILALLAQQANEKEKVALAYRLVLGREADREGQAYYEALWQLQGPLVVLGHLRYAPEGKAKRCKISGLAWRFFLWKLSQRSFARRLFANFRKHGEAPS